MSLPTKAIDRLFERLAATYGSAWTRQWADVPIGDAKSAWAHELGGYRLESLAWALENLPERCPNVIEFRNICRRAPAPDVPALPEPKADPARLRAELAKLDVLRAKTVANPQHHKQWAHQIIARHDAGDSLAPAVLKFAQNALRMHLRPSGA